MLQGQTSNLSSLIVSHVWNEAGIFVRPWVKTPTAFTEFLNLVFPGEKLQSIRESIEDRYPSAGPPFSGDQQARLRKSYKTRPLSAIHVNFTRLTRERHMFYNTTSPLLSTARIYLPRLGIKE